MEHLDKNIEWGRFIYMDRFNDELIRGNNYSIKYDHSKYINGTIHYLDGYEIWSTLGTILKKMDGHIMNFTFKYYIWRYTSEFRVDVIKLVREIKIKDILT